MSNGIATRQNEDNSIAMLAAQRQLYRDAKKFNTVLVALSVWIPFALSVDDLRSLSISSDIAGPMAEAQRR